MLYQDAKHEYKKRHYYRDLVLRSVAALFIGMILTAFFKSFGIGTLLVALVLCGLGFLLAKVS